MLPRKTGKPIAIKCTEQFRQQTEAIADSLGKSLSDYCRMAIDAYNMSVRLPVDSTHKNNTVSNPHSTVDEEIEEHNKMMADIKERIKPKPTMVQSFMKGGK